MGKASPLKTILVVSQLNYVPENYLGLFETLLTQASQHIAGVIFLKNLDLQLAKTILGLRYLGAKRIQRQVLKNIVNLRLRQREKLLGAYKIPFTRLPSMNDPQAIDWCRSKGADLIVNARTRCIYKSDILDLPKLGCLNVHHGLLPKYRGTMCDLYALYEGRPAGFSIHRMNKKIDDGPVFEVIETSPPQERDYLAHLRASSRKEGETLARLLKKIHVEGQLPEPLKCVDEALPMTRNPNRKTVSEMLKKGMLL